MSWISMEAAIILNGYVRNLDIPTLTKQELLDLNEFCMPDESDDVMVEFERELKESIRMKISMMSDEGWEIFKRRLPLQFPSVLSDSDFEFQHDIVPAEEVL